MGAAMPFVICRAGKRAAVPRTRNVIGRVLEVKDAIWGVTVIPAFLSIGCIKMECHRKWADLIKNQCVEVPLAAPGIGRPYGKQSAK